MPSPDSTLVDQALMNRLLGDAQLRAICPDGVWWDAGDIKSQRFVIVSLVDHSDRAVFGGDRAVFGGRAWEDCLYLVKAVMLNSAGGSVKAAAARIDALLEDWVEEIAGFGSLSAHREARVRITEQDSENPAVRWLHRGGRYRVHASVA